MDKYGGYLVPLSEASRAYNKTWYKADDVADLAGRVLWLIEHKSLENLEDVTEWEKECDKIVAELKQIKKIPQGTDWLHGMIDAGK